MSDSSKELLERRIGRLESASFWFGVLLIAGLFSERFASKDFSLIPFTAKDGTTEYHASSAHPKIDTASWYAVWLGASGETYFALMLAFANRRRAADDAIEILKLREKLSPRNLSQSQISAIHTFALAAGEQEIDVVVVGGSSETKQYASLVRLPLIGARWRAQLWSASPDVIEPNISVFFSAWSSNPKLREISEGLVATLISAGIPCKSAVAPFTEIGDPGVLMGDAPKNTQIAHIKMFVGEREDVDLEPNAASPASPR